MPHLEKHQILQKTALPDQRQTVKKVLQPAALALCEYHVSRSVLPQLIRGIEEEGADIYDAGRLPLHVGQPEKVSQHSETILQNVEHLFLKKHPHSAQRTAPIEATGKQLIRLALDFADPLHLNTTYGLIKVRKFLFLYMKLKCSLSRKEDIFYA